MGTTSSKEIVYDLQTFKNEFVRECVFQRETAVLPYSEFIKMVKELNQIFQKTEDINGNTLFFLVKGGSDDSIFWKGFVRISCIKISKATKKMEGFKLLTLREFMQAYKMINHCIKPMMDGSLTCQPSPSAESSSLRDLRKNPLSASMILNQIGDEEIGTDMEECCVCMERRPEVTLPCTHSYCLFCIEQWNVSNKTCPVCRETVENTDDSWVLPEIPNSTEVSEELTKIVNEFSFQNKT